MTKVKGEGAGFWEEELTFYEGSGEETWRRGRSEGGMERRNERKP